MILRGQKPNYEDGTMMLQCDENGYLIVDVAAADTSLTTLSYNHVNNCTVDGYLMVGV